MDRILQTELDWRPYGIKHYESIYTRWLQGYYLPEKFNIDQRRAYLSALINSGQVLREKALEEIKLPPIDPQILEQDMEYVLKKLRLAEVEFQQIMEAPVKTHRDYKSYDDYPQFVVQIGRRNLMKYILSKLPLNVQSIVRNVNKRIKEHIEIN